LLERGQRILQAARELVLAITRARMTMPKSARNLIERCKAYRLSLSSGELELQPESLRGANLPYAMPAPF
jgi:hypothetical protein